MTPYPPLRRRQLFGSLALLALPLAARAGFNIFTSTYTLSQDELQARLATRFPMRLGHADLASVELTAPLLSLDARLNRLMVATRLALLNNLLKPQRVEGVLNFSSALKYDAPSRSILLDQPQVDRIDLDVLSERGADWLTRLGGRLARELLQDQVLYAFKPEQLKWGPKTFEPSGIKVTGDGIAVKLD